MRGRAPRAITNSGVSANQAAASQSVRGKASASTKALPRSSAAWPRRSPMRNGASGARRQAVGEQARQAGVQDLAARGRVIVGDAADLQASALGIPHGV